MGGGAGATKGLGEEAGRTNVTMFCRVNFNSLLYRQSLQNGIDILRPVCTRADW